MNDELDFIYCAILWLWLAFWLYLSFHAGYWLGSFVLHSVKVVV